MSGVLAVAAAVAANTDLKPDLGAGAAYTSTDVGSGSRTAGFTFTLLADGTWTFVRNAGDSGSGTPLSGTWHKSPAAGVGTDFEALIAVGGSALSSNDCATYTALSSDRAAAKTITDSVSDGLPVESSSTLTVTIRKIGTTSPVCQSAFTVDLSADRVS